MKGLPEYNASRDEYKKAVSNFPFVYQPAPCPTLYFTELSAGRNFIDVLVPPVNTGVHLFSKRPNERLELLWVVQNRFLRIAHDIPVYLDYLLHLQRGPLQVKSRKLCESLQLF